MALIKPELTERDGRIKREIQRRRGQRKRGIKNKNSPINQNSRAGHAGQIKHLKVSDLCSLTTAICLSCVTFKQELFVHK